jgi:hypothetical protein
MSRSISLRIALLDNQVVDSNRLPIGRVDDLEIELGDGSPRVTAILTGSEALGGRIGGFLGRWMAATSARLRSSAEEEGPPRIDIAAVEEFEPLIELGVEKDEMPHVAGLERWLAERFVGRLPRSGDASE